MNVRSQARIGLSSAACLVLAATLSADRITPKPQPADYPAHVKVGNIEIGADYLVHSFSSQKQAFFARDYLVFEVAFYPEKGTTYRTGASQFTLRLDGKKQVLFPQQPGIVAASMKYPDENAHPHLEAAAGLGDVVASVGRPAPVRRFPGDPTPTQAPRVPPRAPEDTGRENVPKEQPATVEEVIQQTALEEGDQRAAISGYIFFAYPGNVKKIKSVELLYNDPAGTHALRLR